MTTLDSPRAPQSASAATRSGLATQFAEALAPVVGGELPVHLTLWDGSSAGPADAPRVVVRSPRALRRLLRHPGELGAAQAYVTGELDVEGDLDDALTHVWSVAQERGLGGIRPTPAVVAGVVRLARSAGVLGRPLPPPASQAVVRGRLHSLRRDRAAISHHYDLSNDFYQLILDPHLAYSCGYWRSDDPDYTVEDAQRDKFELVGRKLGLREGSRLLDVGCGWGSMSLYAAEHFGAQVTGVTIAAEQKRFIDARIRERGLQDRVEIRLQDYRDVPDTGFDAVVSLEMGEHVGQRNYPTYAKVLHDAVRPGGRVLVQQMSRRGRHPGGGPFIEQFIAPDMHMRPVGDTVALIEESGLEVRDVHALREHYVRTVDAWHDTFEANWDRAVDLVGEEIARVWRLYLVGGSMAFRDGRMGVDQILAVRPGPSGRSDVEPVRPGGWS
ncbi:cyclopropane-fatty-acyl-phospholipid synthase family protein [Phycicoccus sp. 3266]|uniref:cyclopropane-fatty-acyl-phospholipid synthase family protein n=1 Tax=Phycicoccus sp. 3266 TaxID=2817751 RepID=UPI002860F308|nr:cyclopropane-fatty-acyl-phospholipid synthase family protein [Phycicoccus sp. 3266]MDR6864101.1 cyclopropane-fatty-acyl-phospholipid synthase [Phycicoccus sp. 3266]